MSDLVLRSGGCDSTLILYDLAQGSSVSNPVRTITIESPQIGGMREQARARKLILKELRKRGCHIEPTVLRLETLEGDGLNNLGSPQATLWLCAVQALRQEENLHVGFLMGEDFGNIWQNYNAVFTNLQNAAGRTGLLMLPLIWTTKVEVIARLEDAGLYELCWWCDPGADRKGRPLKEPCGACASCATHLTARWRLKTFGRKDAP